MLRLILCVGDQPESGGYIESMTGGVSNTIEGHPVAYIGGTALCNACESGGVIAKAGGPSRRKHYGAEIALDDDILLCQCPKPPRMAAIVQSVSRHDDRAETLGTVTSNKTIDGRISSVVTGGFDEQVVTRQAVSTVTRTSSKRRMVVCSRGRPIRVIAYRASIPMAPAILRFIGAMMPFPGKMEFVYAKHTNCG